MVITWQFCPLRIPPSSSASSDDIQAGAGFDKDKEREVGCSKKSTKEKHTEWQGTQWNIKFQMNDSKVQYSTDFKP